MRLKNINPLGDLDFPLIGRVGENPLRRGEEFDVDDELGQVLLEQPDNYVLADGATPPVEAPATDAAPAASDPAREG